MNLWITCFDFPFWSNGYKINKLSKQRLVLFTVDVMRLGLFNSSKGVTHFRRKFYQSTPSGQSKGNHRSKKGNHRSGTALNLNPQTHHDTILSVKSVLVTGDQCNLERKHLKKRNFIIKGNIISKFRMPYKIQIIVNYWFLCKIIFPIILPLFNVSFETALISMLFLE